MVADLQLQPSEGLQKYNPLSSQKSEYGSWLTLVLIVDDFYPEIWQLWPLKAFKSMIPSARKSLNMGHD
jgi:hypothetical protein